MTTIYEITADALATLNVPFGMNVYLATGSLPDQFLVYQVVSGVPQEHADNAETKRTYRVQVSLYDRSGLTGQPDINGAMLAAGFTLGPERDLPRDQDTGHYGLAKDFFYLMEATIPTYHLKFDGDDKITIPASASLNNLPSGEFTVEAVISLPFANGERRIIQKTAVGLEPGIIISVVNDAVLIPYMFFDLFDGTHYVYYETPADLVDRGRHHYEFSYKQATHSAKMFIDGIEISYTNDFVENEFVPVDDSGFQLQIMPPIDQDVGAANLFWLKISNVVRHTSNFEPPSLTICPPADVNTVLRLALDEGVGVTAHDTSGNGNDGTIHDAIWKMDW